MSTLTVRGLRKSFGPTLVLDGVDLHVPDGSLTALLGESGCGKTTLLRLVAGFDNPDAGTIHFGDQMVFGEGRSVPARSRRVGYVPQEGALFPHLDVAHNIAFGLPRQQRRTGLRVTELLEVVGLTAAHATRLPHQLSGGQQQRVALARALAPRPTLVLLDEPFSSLDASLRAETRRAVSDALRAAGATAVLVTHDQTEALSMADQVAVMHAGRVVQLDTPAHVYDSPTDTLTAAFVGDAVLLAATVHDGLAQCALGTVALHTAAPDGPVTVLLRPEQILLTEDASGTPARVTDLNYYGHDATIGLRLVAGDHEGPRVLARTTARELPEPDSVVRLTVTGTAQHYPL
ncbi:MAG: ABC transporter ATP-binding protein [Mycobacteriaceae bacterium]